MKKIVVYKENGIRIWFEIDYECAYKTEMFLKRKFPEFCSRSIMVVNVLKIKELHVKGQTNDIFSFSSVTHSQSL